MPVVLPCGPRGLGTLVEAESPDRVDSGYKPVQEYRTFSQESVTYDAKAGTSVPVWASQACPDACRMQLPRHESQIIENNPALARLLPGRLTVKTILLAGNPDPVATAMRLCLKPRTAFHFLQADSVPQVLDRFVESNGKIDILVVDPEPCVSAPGIDVALNLRSLFPGLKILVVLRGSALSCSPLQAAAMRNMPSGSIGILKWPFSPRQLRYHIEQLARPLKSALN